MVELGRYEDGVGRFGLGNSGVEESFLLFVGGGLIERFMILY